MSRRRRVPRRLGAKRRSRCGFDSAAVVSSELEHWLEDVTALLGDSIMDEVASTLPCARRDVEGGMCAAQFALSVFSYAATGSTSSFGRHRGTCVPIDREVPPDLRTRTGNCSTASTASILVRSHCKVSCWRARTDPDVKALVSMTYFEFGDGRVTSFVGYRDPLILVSGRKEVTTAAGIFSVA